MAVKKKAAPASEPQSPTKKSTPKKAAPKKAEPKAAPAAKAATKKAEPKATPAAAAKSKAVADKMTKVQILSQIAEETGLARKEVDAVFKSLSGLIESHMKRRGSGEFTIPEVGVKVVRKKRPAQKARKMISPFTGQEIEVKAKPASNTVRLTALKRLKDTVNA